jgi:nitroreductase
MSEILKPIENRRAKRALSDRPIPRKTAETLLRAAHLAPSCFNNQPWRLVAVDDPKTLTAIKDAMPGANYWTKPSPLIVAVASRRDLDCVLSDGRDYFLFGCGMAVGNLMTQAAEMELIAHPIAGYKPTVVKEIVGIPAEYTLITLVIVGHPGDPDQLSEKHRTIELGPRDRKPLDQVVSWNRFEFNDPAPPEAEA